MAQQQRSLLNVSRFTLDTLNPPSTLVLLLVPGTQLLALVTSLGSPSPRRVALLCINYMEVLAAGPGGQSDLSSEASAEHDTQDC